MPICVVADFVDEPRAVAELIAQVKRLVLRMLTIPARRGRPEDHPRVRSLLSTARGGTLELVGVYVEDTVCTGLCGTEFGGMVGVFRTPAEAEHFAAFHRPPRPDSGVFRIRKLAIRIEEGSITVRRAGEDPTAARSG